MDNNNIGRKKVLAFKILKLEEGVGMGNMHPNNIGHWATTMISEGRKFSLFLGD